MEIGEDYGRVSNHLNKIPVTRLYCKAYYAHADFVDILIIDVKLLFQVHEMLSKCHEKLRFHSFNHLVLSVCGKLRFFLCMLHGYKL